MLEFEKCEKQLSDIQIYFLQKLKDSIAASDAARFLSTLDTVHTHGWDSPSLPELGIYSLWFRSENQKLHLRPK